MPGRLIGRVHGGSILHFTVGAIFPSCKTAKSNNHRDKGPFSETGNNDTALRILANRKRQESVEFFPVLTILGLFWALGTLPTLVIGRTFNCTFYTVVVERNRKFLVTLSWCLAFAADCVANFVPVALFRKAGSRCDGIHAVLLGFT
jgi:hypothetical protein